MDNYTTNIEIEQFVQNNMHKSHSLSEEQKEWLRLYSGAGGQAKKGAAGQGILHEFFTPDWIAERMALLAKKHGYVEGGKILEPSIATGELIRPFENKSNVTAFEINPVSAWIAEKLYNIKVYNQYFETAFLESPRYTVKARKPWIGTDFDLVIGNPPFGAYQNQYSGYFNKKLFRQIESFFIYQSLQVLKSGGLLTFIQASGFLSNGSSYQYIKEQIDKIARLEDAYRLPKVFATTDVPTDIMILRKL